MTDTWHISQWKGWLETPTTALPLQPRRCLTRPAALGVDVILALHCEWLLLRPLSICLCFEPGASTESYVTVITENIRRKTGLQTLKVPYYRLCVFLGLQWEKPGLIHYIQEMKKPPQNSALAMCLQPPAKTLWDTCLERDKNRIAAAEWG